jgi:GNAT superfamily N-acetyltransferase
MEILRAKDSDFIEILYLLRVCILDMNKKGLKHWNSVYPGPEMIREDLNKEAIYLVKDKGVCKGMVTLDNIEPDEYKGIHWSAPASRPLFMHRLAVHPGWQGKGIAIMLMNFAEEFAARNGYDALRIDVHSANIHARHLCEKQAFSASGEFFGVYQQQPFVCYEKKI